MSYLGTCLEFPDHYGQNWSALDDCICDLEWLHTKNVIILIANAHLLFKNLSKNDCQLFWDTLDSAVVVERSIQRMEPNVCIIIHIPPSELNSFTEYIGDDVIRYNKIDLLKLLRLEEHEVTDENPDKTKDMENKK